MTCFFATCVRSSDSSISSCSPAAILCISFRPFRHPPLGRQHSAAGWPRWKGRSLQPFTMGPRPVNGRRVLQCSDVEQRVHA